MNRDAQMKSLRKRGLTLQSIGDKFGVTKERVRQIVDDIKSIKHKKWHIASQSFRRTCFICRVKLKFPTRYCKKCIIENKLDKGGKELPRGMVRGRDNNTCQVCGYKWKSNEKKRLDVHHLDGLCGKWSRKYDRPEMLQAMITVCHKCHYNLHDHRAYGKKKFTTNQQK